MKIVHPRGFEIELKDLADFVVEGKRHGWASGKKPIKFTDGSVGYKHVDRSLFYVDSYIGEGNFIGQEIVFFVRGLPEGNIPIWGMNYRDEFTYPSFVPEIDKRLFKKSVFDYLKMNLMEVPIEFPVRGPYKHDMVKSKETEWGSMTYINNRDPSSKSSLVSFLGNEEICMVNPQGFGYPFKLKYHGGLLVPQHYVVD
jgi:hypothetical protein